MTRHHLILKVDYLGSMIVDHAMMHATIVQTEEDPIIGNFFGVVVALDQDAGYAVALDVQDNALVASVWRASLDDPERIVLHPDYAQLIKELDVE